MGKVVHESLLVRLIVVDLIHSLARKKYAYLRPNTGQEIVRAEHSLVTEHLRDFIYAYLNEWTGRYNTSSHNKIMLDLASCPTKLLVFRGNPRSFGRHAVCACNDK